MNPEAKLWTDTLESYRYPVDLREYQFRDDHNGWFQRKLAAGDRQETVEFEGYFRRHAPCALEPWFEVVFWKLANQYRFRNRTTQRIVQHLTEKTTPGELWHKCSEYVHCASVSEANARFTEFSILFGLKTDSIATIATFPAFLDPARYPMVDNRVAKWVGAAMHEHNRIDPTGAQLVRPKILDRPNQTALKMDDFEFMASWVQWCRHTAKKLTRLTISFQWRARDVEMAVFRAWGEKNAKERPVVHLPPLPPD
jgi:hypothetical protein